mmetsp:Transcript_2218/g.6605  ORF Transcript_2218/g.6605 Transcript_2218/m.6605 type:complete len:204 (-) Transcript_2218:639-1250(-)
MIQCVMSGLSEPNCEPSPSQPTFAPKDLSTKRSEGTGVSRPRKTTSFEKICRRLVSSDSTGSDTACSAPFPAFSLPEAASSSSSSEMSLSTPSSARTSLAMSACIFFTVSASALFVRSDVGAAFWLFESMGPFRPSSARSPAFNLGGYDIPAEEYSLKLTKLSRHSYSSRNVSITFMSTSSGTSCVKRWGSTQTTFSPIILAE